MAQTIEEVQLRQAAFRSCATGAVVVTGPCHDITRLPGGLDADLDEWQAGFTEASGRFMDRREAAAAAGHTGRLEARAYFAGDADPTLEAGHVESWRRLRSAPPDATEGASAHAVDRCHGCDRSRPACEGRPR